MFFSPSPRLSRHAQQQESATPEPEPISPTEGNNNHTNSTTPSPEQDSPIRPFTSSTDAAESSLPRHMSEASEGYPSWLPRRPPPPAPSSTFQSVSGAEAGPSNQPDYGNNNNNNTTQYNFGGRKPTPRSIRVVSIQDNADRREPTDQTRVNQPTGAPARVWSRATTAAQLFRSSGYGPGGDGDAPPRLPQPRFRAPNLQLELLRNPSPWFRLYFFLYPIFVFAHLPLQTFFDFNAVFIMIQVSKFPNPTAPGVPGSGRNWALGAAAYVACWLIWIVVVCVIYELIYSFVRRWRVKRPPIFSMYQSSPAFNFVALSSYTRFSVMQHLRWAAFFSTETGSLRDGLAESFHWYSQNLPTIALLLPRAGLSVALLLSFSSVQPSVVALLNASGDGASQRDGTFFREEDGTLTNYARGVLLANAVWTAWRTLVFCCSWIGLWILSGHGCAGLCGPRHRWEEEEATREKSIRSVYNDVASDKSSLHALWNWREGTRIRIQDAYDLCLTIKPRTRWNGNELSEDKEGVELLGPHSPTAPAFEGMDQIMAAVGFPSVPTPARRGVLSNELFIAKPQEEFSAIIPPPPVLVKRSSKEKRDPKGPLMALPYPFSGPGAHASSKDQIPFPPSPTVPASGMDKQQSAKAATPSASERDEAHEEEEEEDDEDMDSEEPASTSGRASGSMSSLGRPVVSRYPFQFRTPARTNTRGHEHQNSASSGSASGPSRGSGPSTTASRFSRSTQSTGNFESSDSAPHSHRSYLSSLGGPSPSHTHHAIPMPPRHPQSARGRGRARAGTVPSAMAGAESSSVGHPRAQSVGTQAQAFFGMPSSENMLTDDDDGIDHSLDLGEEDLDEMEDEDEDAEQLMDQPIPDGPYEAAERDDFVGLLSVAEAAAASHHNLSPKSSLGALRHRASTSFGSRHHRRSQGSNSGSGSRSGSNTSSRNNSSHSGSSSARSRANSLLAASAVSARSRAQSLIQSMGTASQSLQSLASVRSRAHSSMARLEEDHNSSSGSPPPSPSLPAPYYSSSENNHSRSGSGSVSDALSASENNTFGHPLRSQWQAQPRAATPEDDPADTAEPTSRLHAPHSRSSMTGSYLSLSTQRSARPSQRTISPPDQAHVSPQHSFEEPAGGVPIFTPPPRARIDSLSFMTTESRPDISTAAQSFVTAPATVQGTTDSSGRTVSSWGAISNLGTRPQGPWEPV